MTGWLNNRLIFHFAHRNHSGLNEAWLTIKIRSNMCMGTLHVHCLLHNNSWAHLVDRISIHSKWMNEKDGNCDGGIVKFFKLNLRVGERVENPTTTTAKWFVNRTHWLDNSSWCLYVPSIVCWSFFFERILWSAKQRSKTSHRIIWLLILVGDKKTFNRPRTQYSRYIEIWERKKKSYLHTNNSQTLFRECHRNVHK